MRRIYLQQTECQSLLREEDNAPSRSTNAEEILRPGCPRPRHPIVTFSFRLPTLGKTSLGSP